MPEGFRSLASILRQAQDDEVTAQDDEVTAQDDEVTARAPRHGEPVEPWAQDAAHAPRHGEPVEPWAQDAAHAPRHGEPVEPWAADSADMVRDVRLFHARVIEAVDAAVDALVTDIAADVLARELLLAPADIEAIVDRALARFASDEPLRVRVHPEDARQLHCGIPVAADERLRPGDAVIELRSGSVDASLGVRLATLLQARV